MKVKINNNKKIGKVIYVVEGDVTEEDIIVKIYNKLLNYNIIKYSKINNEYTELITKNDKYSKVYIIPSKNSSIKSLNDTKDYLDEIYHKLAIDFDLDVENSSIYYIYDRDRESNRPGTILNLLDKLKNSKDNDNFYINGLLLLSYPCIEALYCNLFNDTVRLTSGKNAKNYTIEYSNQDINQSMLESSSILLLNKILKINHLKEFDISCIDSFNEINKSIFNYEENEYQKYNNYDTLSLLLISLLDLGIIEIENNEID